jgi:histone-lysine N-methyltransferase ASH1L
MKKLDKKEQARLRAMVDEAQQRAQVEADKKQAQIDRGPSWRGWATWEEAQAELAEKARKKREAELTSDRALRIAKRQGAPSAHLMGPPDLLVPASRPSRKLAVPKSKKSVAVEEEILRESTNEPDEDEDESDEDLKVEVVKNISRSKLKRARPSALSSTTDVDDEDRPASKSSSRSSLRRSGISRKTTVSAKQSAELERTDELNVTEDSASEIVVTTRTSLATELTHSNGASLTKSSSKGDVMHATEGAAAEDEDQITVKHAAKASKLPKRTQSMRDRVKQAISNVSSGGMKSLKQSTLNFAKRS